MFWSPWTKYRYSNTSHVILYQVSRGRIRRLRLYSNTSHVILYRLSADVWTREQIIQIHLMLFFIIVQTWELKPTQPFKYISCYSLSIYDAIMTKTRSYSNTSHVILYQNVATGIYLSVRFKYISCYSLSATLFYFFEVLTNSNTSHVILYHDHPVFSKTVTDIQIHLMLFFIEIS